MYRKKTRHFENYYIYDFKIIKEKIKKSNFFAQVART